MSNKRRLCTMDTEQGKTIEIDLYYELGGMNYFTGNVRKRGYYLSVAPVEVSDSGEYKTKMYTAFTGVVTRVKPAKRFSQKTIENFNPKKEVIDHLLHKVLSKNNLTLKK